MKTDPADPQAGARGTCGTCAKFLHDPRAFEAALPGFAVLSSGFSSVRGETGLCVLHDDFRLPSQGCGSWCAREK